jgi:predicted nuclease of restriction endonuclease-like (RecB) superfamily
MNDDIKLIYRICTTEIVHMMSTMPREVDLTVNDPQRPPNCIKLLSLMQNYVKTDLEYSDLTLVSRTFNHKMVQYKYVSGLF